MKLGRIPLGLLAAASLAACTISSDMLEGKKVDYKSAGQLPTLEIPPDLTPPARAAPYLLLTVHCHLQFAAAAVA